MTLDVAVFVAARAAPALAERTALLEEVTGRRPYVVGGPADLPAAVRHGRSAASGAYLLDVNRPMALLALALRARGVPYVVDTGDDPYALALGLGLGRRAAAVRRATESAMLAGARGVVCRGYHHRQHLVRRTRRPVAWHPDTAPDSLYASAADTGDEQMVSTFGSTGAPRDSYPRVYGEEVLDVLSRGSELRGVLVGRGAGLDYLRRRALRLQVADRLDVHEDLPLAALASQVQRAAFLTSLQSDDRAGEVRTTGKLPLALALGRCLLASDVGEAARVLPPELRLPGRAHPADEIVAAVRRGVPAGWQARARELAETYRRSRVAASLRDTIASWST